MARVTPHSLIMREAAACSRMKPRAVFKSWYCEPCAVEVYERRCPHCGKLQNEKH